MEKSVIIVPAWDEVTGTYEVVGATMKGLGEVHGDTREQFQENLEALLPANVQGLVVYDEDDVIHLHHDLN